MEHDHEPNLYELHYYGVGTEDERDWNYQKAKRITPNVLGDYDTYFADYNYGIAKALAYANDILGCPVDVGSVSVWWSYHEGILYVTLDVTEYLTGPDSNPFADDQRSLPTVRTAWFSITPDGCFPPDLPEAQIRPLKHCQG